MTITFTSQPKPTLGVELEIQLIDRETKNLTPAAIQVLQKASKLSHFHIKAELTEAMIEVNTDICQNIHEVEKNLRKQCSKLRKIVEPLGVELAVSGTHPFQDWRERRVMPTTRHLSILEKYQWLARRWTTFGMHVHVGVRDGERAIRILNALISYLPHLLALSASSPFWGGTDTGLASSRMAVLESFPTGGLPYYFPDWKGFQKYYETLMATGAIGSIKDLYWDIRPHFDFGTLEIRVCDGLPTFRETLGLVALIHCLVVWIDDALDRQLRSPHIHMQQYWLAPENKWQATRYGLDGMVVAQDGSERMQIRDAVKLLLQELEPVAQSLECADELESIHEILQAGPSATRQRHVFAKTGSHRSIVESLIKEFQEEPNV